MTKVALARRLESATSNEMLYIDPHTGQVRSPVGMRVLNTLFSIEIGIIGGAAVFSLLHLNPFGFFVSAGLALVGGGWITNLKRVNQSAALIVANRLDEAEVLLRKAEASRITLPRIRGVAAHKLGALESRRGEHERAVAWYDRALVHLRGRTIFSVLCQLHRTQALTNLGRLDEAEKALAALKRPTGDYALFQYFTTELYLALARKRHTLNADALHERVRFALPITRATALIALLGWAHLAISDADQGWHLTSVALDRLDEAPDDAERLACEMPLLYEWIDANAADCNAAIKAERGS